MLNEQERKQWEREEQQTELERKRTVLARLKDNLSDENKALRRKTLLAPEDVTEEEESIVRQITKFEADIRESADAS